MNKQEEKSSDEEVGWRKMMWKLVEEDVERRIQIHKWRMKKEDRKK